MVTKLDERTWVLDWYDLPSKLLSFKAKVGLIIAIDEACKKLGLNRSEFMRCAIRFTLDHLDQFKLWLSKTNGKCVRE